MITNEFATAIELIRHPERMDRSTIVVLKEALNQYPFYQTLHLLLLQNMYKVHDPGFGAQLKQSAVMIADRSVLFDMIEGANYAIPVQPVEDAQQILGSGDRTLSLIDSFLKTLPEMSGPEASAVSSEPVDPSVDYSAYLEQLPDYQESPATIASTPSLQDTLTDSLEEEPTNGENALPPSTPVPSDVEKMERESSMVSKPVVPEVNEDEFTVAAIRQRLAKDENFDAPDEDGDIVDNAHSKDYFTETMAAMYIKQQKYDQALEIIKGLSIDNPKKNAYFADQIRYLELLIRINKNKK